MADFAPYKGTSDAAHVSSVALIVERYRLNFPCRRPHELLRKRLRSG